LSGCGGARDDETVYDDDVDDDRRRQFVRPTTRTTIEFVVVIPTATALAVVVDVDRSEADADYWHTHRRGDPPSTVVRDAVDETSSATRRRRQ
jgi:hypothetical protein